MKIRNRMTGTALAMLLLLGLPWTCAPAADLPPLSHSLTTQAPRPAPALQLKDLDGTAHDLAQLKGRVVLVNFWATWCPPCRREMPSMERLSQALKGEAFSVLAVDVGEDADTIDAFTSQFDAAPTFPILLDTQQPRHAGMEGGRPADDFPGRSAGTHRRQRHRRARVRSPRDGRDDPRIA